MANVSVGMVCGTFESFGDACGCGGKKTCDSLFFLVLIAPANVCARWQSNALYIYCQILVIFSQLMQKEGEVKMSGTHALNAVDSCSVSPQNAMSPNTFQTWFAFFIRLQKWINKWNSCMHVSSQGVMWIEMNVSYFVAYASLCHYTFS